LKNHYYSMILLLIILFLSMSPGIADCEGIRYIYDKTGRLSMAIRDDGKAAIYIYDSVGNLQSIVTQQISEAPPILNSINPDIFFRGIEREIVISGQNLITLKDLTSNGGIIIKEFFSTDDLIRARIYLPPSTPTGDFKFFVTTDYGETEIDYYVTTADLNPENLTLTINELGEIDVSVYPPINRSYTLNVENSAPSVVSAPSQVIIPSGGHAMFEVTALSEGVAVIRVAGAGVSISVTPPFATSPSDGGDSVESLPVSVQMPFSTTVSNKISPLVSVEMPFSFDSQIISDIVSVVIQKQ